MRLIHVPTLSFEEFDSGDFPPYAILSHRWEDEEVTYQDVINDGFRNIHKKGIYKILGCCGLATEKKLQYVWVDTCCIDRSSSAELSEAINSMFEWYRLARICFAYLVDVVDQDLKHSVWFSRSWTLQELVAPEHVHFFSGSWKFIGTKDELAEDVSKVTGISADVLRYKINIYDLSVARRMGWARKRQCRRVEDIAYSLLGIFDINMPLLYGEGKKAFRRLQEEIIKQIPDHTIFLWSSTPEDDGRLLSPSPDRFDPNCISRSKRSDQSKPFTVTNLGLSITVSLCPWYAGMDCYTGIYLATLECELLNSDNLEEWQEIGLFLRRRPHSNIYERVTFLSSSHGFRSNSTEAQSETRDIFISLDLLTTRDSRRSHEVLYQGMSEESEHGFYGFGVSFSGFAQDDTWSADVLPQCHIVTDSFWDSDRRVLEMSPGRTDAMMISLPNAALYPLALKLGFDFDFQPCCIIGKIKESPTQGLRFCQDVLGELQWMSLADESKPWSGTPRRFVCATSGGFWFLKANYSSGLEARLIPQESSLPVDRKGAYCLGGVQVSVGIYKERIHGRRGWALDIDVALCKGKSCAHI